MPDKTELLQQEHKRQEDRKLSENTSSDTSLLSAQQLSTAVQRAQTNPQTLSHRDALHLQRSLGNKATTQLMRSSQPTQTAASSGGLMGGLMPGVEEENADVMLGGMPTLTHRAPSDRVQREDPLDAGAPVAGTPAPPVTVSTANKEGPTWNPHGHFNWVVGFTTSGRSGWIVQEIVNTYEGTDSAGKAIPTANVTPQYWEAWAVDASGAISPSVGANHDYWIRPGRGAGSKGKWSMKGNVHFTTTDPATQGFTAGGVKNAGILLSTTSAPTGLGSVLLARNANGVWDSTGTSTAHAGAAS